MMAFPKINSFVARHSWVDLVDEMSQFNGVGVVFLLFFLC